MKKNYLFTLAALLLGSTIANAQNPLDGYEAPSFTAPGNCGKVISLSTSGALENYTDLKDLTTGKIEQELFVAPGAKVEFSIKITTYWGRFAIFTDANSSKEITRLLQCGVPGPSNPYNDETNGVLVHAEDNPNPTPDGTLPSITIPQDAAEGTVYLFRMIFTSMDDINTYAPSFKEGIYHDIKITVKNNIQRYTINIATPENGTLTIKNGETPIESGAQVPEGTVLSVAAAPSTGYELVSIKNNDEIYASETFVASADANFAAQFKKLASTGDAMLMSAPGYGEAGDCQLRFSDTVLGSHNTDKNQVESDQRSRNYTFSAWISTMGYNGVLMGHVQNSITWAVEGSYGVGVKDGKLAVWYRKWDGNSTGCPGVPTPAVSENTTLYPGEFAFISLVTSNDGRTFKVYKNGEEAISQEVEDGGLALLYDACDFAIGDSKYNQMPCKVEEVQLWNKTLTPEEIEASMFGPKADAEGLVAHYLPESADATTVENLAGDIDAYYRKNGTVTSGNFPMADALQKTNGRSTVEVTYNTPVEEEAAYELRRFDVAIGESPAPVKTYSNLYAVNLGEKYKFASVSVNDIPLENINDPIKVTDQNLTVNATFELATGVEDVTAEATAYYNDKVLYMPQGATAVIYNLLGTAVAEATEMTTNLENLPAGIYLAKVSMGENTTIIRFKK
ncbi:LamG-like jellyroll fold domain-containing protein [Barnesiella intestinihominis]|uniref:LamG-like jellyroll fold domain-containing protein n=2 Tax=Barnesiella intestinihominis TaxID=487174 RepID=UPI001897543E|nr:LamG-like jellyroll fold domain-containing protein [Barnesiella intestinihominis]MDB0678231.1 T9SS type A sorting domain-containing protein [Barnesiella intestinihominis]MDB0683873.1 T9SS type A sorting domain-containing protein [Barnesiella intestinihominis]